MRSRPGELRLHRWAEAAYAAGADRDLFILVANQAAALGLSAFDGRSDGLQWHPAGVIDGWTTRQRAGLVFQCGFQSEVDLPLQSAGLVLQQAVDRVGSLELERLDVQVGWKVGDPMRFVDGRDWFEFTDPASAVPARIAWSGTATDVEPWLGRTVTFDRATEDGWEVTLRSSSLDFLGWVAGVLAWASPDQEPLVGFAFDRQASFL